MLVNCFLESSRVMELVCTMGLQYMQWLYQKFQIGSWAKQTVCRGEDNLFGSAETNLYNLHILYDVHITGKYRGLVVMSYGIIYPPPPRTFHALSVN